MPHGQFQAAGRIDIQKNATSQIQNIMEQLDDSEDLTDEEEKDESSKTDSDEDSKSNNS